MDKITTRLREINNILKEKEQEIKSENVMNKNFLKLLKKKILRLKCMIPNRTIRTKSTDIYVIYIYKTVKC